MASHYNCFDCETGGLTVDYELLTIYFAIFDMDFNFIDDLSIITGPSRDIKDYKVTKGAMDVNRINLEEHVRRADFTDYKEAAKKLKDWCEKKKAELKPGRSKLFLPLGQNIGFDLKFVYHFLMPFESWEEYFHYQIRDTQNNYLFLADAGLVPKGNQKLGDQVEYFGLKMGEAHTAKDDTLMTTRVYRSQLELLRAKKDILSGIPAEMLKAVEG